MNINELNLVLENFTRVKKIEEDFTFMEITGFSHYENISSNVLAFYLQPKNNHGLGKTLLRALIEVINMKCKKDTLNIDDIGRINVHREYITNAGNRIDILIESNEWIIGIENKIYHTLRNDLSDYSETIDSLIQREKRPKETRKIVLSLYDLKDPDKVKMETNDFININYSEFICEIKKQISNILIDSPRNKYAIYLIEYIQSIEKLIKGKEMNPETKLFFKNNASTIEELINGYNSYKTILSKRIFEVQALLNEDWKSEKLTQWVWNNSVLVHDLVKGDIKFGIDFMSSINGYEISIIGRNKKSKTLINKSDFKMNFGNKYDLMNREQRIIVLNINIDTDIENVVTELKEILEIVVDIDINFDR